MNNSDLAFYNGALRKVRFFCVQQKLTKNMPKEYTAIKEFFKFNDISIPETKNLAKLKLLELAKSSNSCLDFSVKRKIKKQVELSFYDSEEWKILKTIVLKAYGVKCMKCGVTKTEMHVDHIKPRSKYPKLELCFGNLQVLCRACNIEKSNIDETDYRLCTLPSIHHQAF